MSRVRNKNTKPEIAVRRVLYAAGYRYRLHVAKLPGKPDLVFLGRRKIIFVHGCFWHRHSGCTGARIPKSRTEFWTEKLAKNSLRDHKKQADLEALGWSILVVWECEIHDSEELKRRLITFLEASVDTAPRQYRSCDRIYNGVLPYIESHVNRTP